ncbi:Peptidase M23B [Burkholderiales bacterium 8X]|nr:Peptidase M23B [Burkholderiales bacterium 8X]
MPSNTFPSSFRSGGPGASSSARHNALATLSLALLLSACGTPPPPAPTRPPAPVRPAPAPPPAPAPAPAPPAQPAAFIRPAPGATLARFDGKANKGLDIAGNLGDPVVASADGRVVYVGGELRGYGNMVIVKHNETFLTAYAHLKTIGVKEKDVIRQGQKIGEMGSSEANRVKLHFEVRKQGVAVDPEPYLSGQLR